MINLPAQKVQQPITNSTRYANPSELLTQTIRMKYEELRSKPNLKYNMVKSYNPIHVDNYNICFNQFQNLLANMQEGQNVDLTKYLPLIFAALEGSIASIEPQKILIKKFGPNIQKLEIDQIIKTGKVKGVNYGNDKRRLTNIRQVANKDSFQSMGQFYDLKEMRNHRKICSTIKGYLNTLKNFMDCMKDTEQSQIFNPESMQNVRYIEFANKELGFMKLKISPQILGESQQGMIDEADERKEEMVKTENVIDQVLVTPVKKQMPSAISPKEETASGQKDQAENNQEIKSNGQQNKSKPKQSEEGKQTRQRKTKEEIEKERLQKLREKEMKALEKQEKQKQRLLKLQQKEKERLAKQKEREMDKQAKEKLRLQKERQRQAKQKEKQAERLAKQAQRLNKQKERLAKDAAKQAERIAKQKKNSPGQNIQSFFLKKNVQQTTPIKSKPIEAKLTSLQQTQYQFLSSINKSIIPINQLCNKFLPEKMKDQNTSFKPYYSSVAISRSRLQFQNFLISQQRFNQYFCPHQQYQNGKYDDSSIEYQDFCGDFCDEKIDEMSVQGQQQASENSAIVPDSYISQDQMSSLNQSKDQIRIKIGQGGEWSFANSNNYTAEKYVMFTCYEDQSMPLPLNQPEESKELTLNLKCELYKEIHGSYGPKDLLIKKLATIAEKVPKSYLDTLIKETTTKRGYQRLVKPQIIDFLTEQRQNFAKQLQELKSKRDQDNMIEMKGRMNQKQRQIQRLILEEAGTYYIIDMLHFLREKGYRMLKRELKEFIDARTGSQWDDVRKRMNRMQPKSKDKEKQKMTEFLKKKEKQQDKQKKESSQEGEELKEEHPSAKQDEDQNPQDKMQGQP